VILISVLSLTISLFVSCDKNEDLSSPVINFVAPLENTTIDLPDTLKVVANVYDDRNLVSVMAVIVDDLGRPVTTAVYKYPGYKEYTLSAFLLIDDKAITSGTYRILITAFDGTNSKNEYQDILQSYGLKVKIGG